MKRTKTKSKSIARIMIDKETYSVRATGHALDRMQERKVDEWVVSGDIIAFGKEKLLSLRAEEKEIALIDVKRDITIIMAFRKNTIFIITVIDRSEVYILDGTVVRKLET